MDINLLKDFNSVTKILKNSEFLKKQQEISKIIANQSFNYMIKQQGEISKIAQIQLDLLKNNSSIFENVTQHLLKESNFFKTQQEISTTIMNQSYNSITKLQNEISRIAQYQLELIKNDSSIFENSTQQLFKDKNFIKKINNLDFDINHEDIEKLNKKIEQKEAFTKKDLITFDRIISIIGLLFAFYVYYFPDDTESIKIQQMINNLDNKISKSLKQELYYEVVKQVNVKESVDSKSKKIAVAEPKQKLLIIQNKPYWLQVEYFDEIKNETIIGWISKKYTKRLD